MMWNLIILLLSISTLCSCQEFKSSQTSGGSSCPDQFEDWNQNSLYCYLLKIGDENQKTWNEAQKICSDVGGNLASEQTKSERNYIVEKLKSTDHIWIGLWGPDDAGQRSDPNKWTWNDGSPMSYKDWGENEPSTNGQCGYIRPERESTWDDEPCENKKGFLCKIMKKTTPCTQETPDDGWVTVETGLTDHCYLRIADTKTWQAANDDCVSKNSSLVSIHSDNENNFIMSIISDVGWSGLLKVHKGGQRRWSDQTAYDYDNWRNGEPNDKDGVEDCTEIEGAGTSHPGFWNDCSCSYTHEYICKKWKPGHEPTEPPPTAKPTGHCGDDHSNRLIEFEGHCYKLSGTNPSEGVQWSEATEKCIQLGNGYQLASIHSERENAFIYTMINELHYENEENQKKYWFGATDLDEEAKWAFSDGSTWDYTNWKDGEPDNKNEEDCARLNGAGVWVDEQCGDKYGVLCKTQVSPSFKDPPQRESCIDVGRPSFYRFKKGCYKWENEPQTWDEAELRCIEQDSHLASILDDAEQSFIFTQPQLGIDQEQAWIGLNNKENQEIFKWSDGWNLEYDNWLSDQQMNGDEAQCTVLDVNAFTCGDICEYPDGNWISKPCTEKHPYVCKFGEVPPDSLKCPSLDWLLFGGSCYRSYGAGSELSWNEAQDYCLSQGGNLMSVGSEEEDNAVLQHYIFDDFSLTDVFWIGLRRKMDAEAENYNKDYEWIDGSLNDYSRFAQHYPNSNSGVDACMMVNNKQDQQGDSKQAWKNNNCEIRLQYVCEIPAGYTPPTTLPPPTILPPQPCDPNNPADMWVKFPADQGGDGEYCYLFNTFSQETWHGAKDACILHGGRLASIHSTQENDFILHNLARNGQGWVGYLKDPSTSSFKWTDGSDTDFYRWGSKQPDDNDDMESCVSLQSYTGSWYDESCYNIHEYTCKKPVNGTWPTPSPTTIPEGHCRSEFQEFQGYCYALMGLEKSVDGNQDNKNWHNAKNRCNNHAVDNNHFADLASIHTDREAAFITTLMGGWPNDNITGLWIGGHTIENNQGQFGWTDETKWNYDHWIFGEPNGQPGENTCTRLVNRDWNEDVGKWDDWGCDNRLGYICKSKASTSNNPPPPPEKCSDSQVAGKEFIKFDGACYKWMSSPLSWAEAENSCQSMNAHLVSVNSPMEEAYAFSRAQGEASWIGLSNRQNRDIFMWSDGWRATYLNWGNQDNQNDQSCVQLNVTNGGRWDAINCDISLPYMCKFSQELPPTPNPNGMCPDDFQDIIPDSSYCYMIKDDYQNGNGLSWGNAHSECNAYNGKLASIHSDDEMNALQQALQGATKDVWIGLQADVSGQWNWVDKTPFDYKNWDEGEPNHNDDFLYCAKVWEEHVDRAGKWDDCLCTNLNGFICKIDKLPGPTEPPGSTTTMTTLTTTTSNSSNGGGLGAGAIAAIVIFILIAIGGGIGFCIYMRRKNYELNKFFGGYQRQNATQNVPIGGGGFDNVSYETKSEVKIESDNLTFNDI